MNSAKANQPELLGTASFYRFVPIDQPAQLREQLYDACLRHELTGTILLAEEGINGTLCGAAGSIETWLNDLQTDARFAGIDIKRSSSAMRTLARLKVKVKPEIITINQPDIDPARESGQYVEPKDWNALISDPDTVLIDTRNDYEVAIGRFAGARDPGTENFSDLPAWLDKQSDLKDKPAVAMYCTGGIRCEKSTALLKARGFDRVYHLRGGILNYLEKVPREDSLWEGECFVFDERVSVDHDLNPGSYELCGACGHPVDAQAKASSHFVENISCEHCFNGAKTASSA